MQEINKFSHMPWNAFLYASLKIISKCIRRHFKAKEEVSEAFKTQLKEGPMIIVCNHMSNYDFAYFMAPFKREKVNFVVADIMKLSSKKFAYLFKHYHVILKKQFYADFTCIKTIKRYLDDGINVIICPEGKETSDGQTGIIMPSIARLLKWLKYPVGYIKIHGLGLLAPKWGHSVRKGPSELSCDMLLKKEEVESLDNDSIYKIVSKKLAFNEHEYQMENGYIYTGEKYAEGLENVLYKCPVCGEEFTIKSKDNIMTCSHCGSVFEYMNDGRIIEKNDRIEESRVDKWSNSEKIFIKTEVQKNDFFMEDDVDLLMPNEKENGYNFICHGHIKMDKENLVFEAKNIPNENISYLLKNDLSGLESLKNRLNRLEFPLKNYNTIANIPGYSIDMCDSEYAYRFVVTSRPSSAKYALAIEALSN